jgi:hypothetical protein
MLKVNNKTAVPAVLSESKGERDSTRDPIGEFSARRREKHFLGLPSLDRWLAEECFFHRNFINKGGSGFLNRTAGDEGIARER